MDGLRDSCWLARYIGKPERTLDQWAYLGIGPRYIKVGRSRRYRVADVEAWLRSKMGDAATVQKVRDALSPDGVVRQRTAVKALVDQIKIGMAVSDVSAVLGEPTGQVGVASALGTSGAAAGSEASVRSAASQQCYVWRRDEGEWKRRGGRGSGAGALGKRPRAHIERGVTTAI